MLFQNNNETSQLKKSWWLKAKKYNTVDIQCLRNNAVAGNIFKAV